MICKWCHSEIDVSGKPKGRRITCPHCRNSVIVGE